MNRQLTIGLVAGLLVGFAAGKSLSLYRLQMHGDRSLYRINTLTGKTWTLVYPADGKGSYDFAAPRHWREIESEEER